MSQKEELKQEVEVKGEVFKEVEPYAADLGFELENYLWDAYICSGCCTCYMGSWVHLYGTRRPKNLICPSWVKYSFDLYSCVGKMRIIDRLLRICDINITRTIQDAAFKCMLCGACDYGCKINVALEPLLAQEALRIRVARELGILSQHERVVKNILEAGNIFGSPPERRLYWAKGIKVAEKSDVLYFPGCCSSYSNTEISQATAEILNIAGIDFMLLAKDDRCCGRLIYESGQLEEAKKWAKENVRRLRETKAGTIVCSCAECYYVLKVLYPRLMEFSTADLGFEVVHIAELAERLIKEERIKLSETVEMTVTYHDPCKLGRMSEPWTFWKGTRGMWGVRKPDPPYRRGVDGVYKQPRNILNAIPGVQVVEMPRIEGGAWCCGSGGGVLEAYPDLASYAADERMEEAAATEAKAIVSACPWCKGSFLKSGKRGELGVYDITELIVKSLAREGGSHGR